MECKAPGKSVTRLLREVRGTSKTKRDNDIEKRRAESLKRSIAFKHSFTSRNNLLQQSNTQIPSIVAGTAASIDAKDASVTCQGKIQECNLSRRELSNGTIQDFTPKPAAERYSHIDVTSTDHRDISAEKSDIEATPSSSSSKDESLRKHTQNFVHESVDKRCILLKIFSSSESKIVFAKDKSTFISAKEDNMSVIKKCSSTINDDIFVEPEKNKSKIEEKQVISSVRTSVITTANIEKYNSIHNITLDKDIKNSSLIVDTENSSKSDTREYSKDIRSMIEIDLYKKMSVQNMHLNQNMKKVDITYAEAEKINMQIALTNSQEDKEVRNVESVDLAQCKNMQNRVTSNLELPITSAHESTSCDVGEEDGCNVSQNVGNLLLTSNDNVMNDEKTTDQLSATASTSEGNSSKRRQDECFSTQTTNSSTSSSNLNYCGDNHSLNNHSADDGNNSDIEIEIKIKPKLKFRVSRKFSPSSLKETWSLLDKLLQMDHRTSERSGRRSTSRSPENNKSLDNNKNVTVETEDCDIACDSSPTTKDNVNNSQQRKSFQDYPIVNENRNAMDHNHRGKDERMQSVNAITTENCPEPNKLACDTSDLHKTQLQKTSMALPIHPQLISSPLIPLQSQPHPQLAPPQSTRSQLVPPQSTPLQLAPPQPTRPQLVPPQSAPLQLAPQPTHFQPIHPQFVPPQSTHPQAIRPQSASFQLAPPQSTHPRAIRPHLAPLQPTRPQLPSRSTFKLPSYNATVRHTYLSRSANAPVAPVGINGPNTNNDLTLIQVTVQSICDHIGYCRKLVRSNHVRMHIRCISTGISTEHIQRMCASIREIYQNVRKLMIQLHMNDELCALNFVNQYMKLNQPITIIEFNNYVDLIKSYMFYAQQTLEQSQAKSNVSQHPNIGRSVPNASMSVNAQQVLRGAPFPDARVLNRGKSTQYSTMTSTSNVNQQQLFGNSANSPQVAHLGQSTSNIHQQYIPSAAHSRMPNYNQQQSIKNASYPVQGQYMPPTSVSNVGVQQVFVNTSNISSSNTNMRSCGPVNQRNANVPPAPSLERAQYNCYLNPSKHNYHVSVSQPAHCNMQTHSVQNIHPGQNVEQRLQKSKRLKRPKDTSTCVIDITTSDISQNMSQNVPNKRAKIPELQSKDCIQKKASSTNPHQDLRQETLSACNVSQNTFGTAPRTFTSQRANILQNTLSNLSSQTDNALSTLPKSTHAEPQKNDVSLSVKDLNYNFNPAVLTDVQKIILRKQIYSYFKMSDQLKYSLNEQKFERLHYERLILFHLFLILSDYLKSLIEKFRTAEKCVGKDSPDSTLQDQSVLQKNTVQTFVDKFTRIQPNRDNEISSTNNSNLEKQSSKQNIDSNISKNSKPTAVKSNLEARNEESFSTPEFAITKEPLTKDTKLQEQNNDTLKKKFQRSSLVDTEKRPEITEATLPRHSEVNLITEVFTKKTETETQDNAKINESLKASWPGHSTIPEENSIRELSAKNPEKEAQDNAKINESLKAASSLNKEFPKLNFLLIQHPLNLSQDALTKKTEDALEIAKSNANEKSNNVETESVHETSDVATLNNNGGNDATLRSPYNTEEQNKEVYNASNEISSDNLQNGMRDDVNENIEIINSTEIQSDPLNTSPDSSPALSNNIRRSISPIKSCESTEILQVHTAHKEHAETISQTTSESFDSDSDSDSVTDSDSNSDSDFGKLYIDESVKESQKQEQCDKVSSSEEDNINMSQYSTRLFDAIKCDSTEVKPLSLMKNIVEVADTASQDFVTEAQNAEILNEEPLEANEILLEEIPLKFEDEWNMAESTIQSIDTAKESEDVKEEDSRQSLLEVKEMQLEEMSLQLEVPEESAVSVCLKLPENMEKDNMEEENMKEVNMEEENTVKESEDVKEEESRQSLLEVKEMKLEEMILKLEVLEESSVSVCLKLPENMEEANTVKESEDAKEKESRQSLLEVEKMQFEEMLLKLEVPEESAMSVCLKLPENMEEENMEEENVEVDTYTNIKTFNEQLKHTYQKCFEESQTSSCNSVQKDDSVDVNVEVSAKNDNADIECISVKNDDFEIAITPSILDIRSISPSLFEKMENTDTFLQNGLESFDEKDGKSLDVNDNLGISDEVDEPCLRCKRKSTVYCQACLEAHYCSKRCSTLHWKAEHYKQCKRNSIICIDV